VWKFLLRWRWWDDAAQHCIGSCKAARHVIGGEAGKDECGMPRRAVAELLYRSNRRKTAKNGEMSGSGH
jgi:hypothetical protein